MSGHDLINFFFTLVIGMHLGIRFEAAHWRSKAKSGFRMESKGKLYKVEEEV